MEYRSVGEQVQRRLVDLLHFIARPIGARGLGGGRFLEGRRDLGGPWGGCRCGWRVLDRAVETAAAQGGGAREGAESDHIGGS